MVRFNIGSWPRGKNISLLIFGGVCGIINLSTGGVLPPVFLPAVLCGRVPTPAAWGFFYKIAALHRQRRIIKGVFMQKISFMGNGRISEFYFNFPYFEHSNIIVTVDNAPAHGYNIIGNAGGPNADVPFNGGKVVFDTPPRQMEYITIARQLPLIRIADYQPMARIEPVMLNQDLNYLMEVLKDKQDDLDTLRTQYAENVDHDSAVAILARISAIHDEIVDIDAKIAALGDISTLRTDVSTNSENITAVNVRTMGMTDYVIESQFPTAENNYTWFRKYKSKWVEMGGETTNNASSVTFPIEMADTHYTVIRTQCGTGNQQSYYPAWVAGYKTRSTTGFTFSCATTNNIWYVCGLAA